jgi:fructokinase
MPALASTPQVICLGECLLDRIFHRYDTSQSGIPFWDDYPGGAPANVAFGLAKLGTSTGFLGCLGSDEAGQRLLSELTAGQVNCDQVQIASGAPTRVVLVQRDEHGERHFVGFSQPSVDGYADTLLRLEPRHSTWFQTASVLVMGTLGLAYPLTQRSMAQALQWAHAHNVQTIVDINWRPAFWPEPQQAPEIIRNFLDGVHIVKFSQEEAHWLFHTTNPRKIFEQLSQPSLVMVTAGAAGCQYATSTLDGEIAAFQVDCEDTTGAGDAFLAALIHRLCQDGFDSLSYADQLQHVIRYASAAGALTTLRAGAMAAQPQAEEVRAFLYLQPSAPSANPAPEF